MNTKIQEILTAANITAVTGEQAFTVINDGQFRYPVLTGDMEAWINANGQITASNYEKFCDAVECIGQKQVGTVGSAGMISLCEALVDAGADYVTLG